MPEHTDNPYTFYLQKLTSGLSQLSATQRVEIEQELLAHLEDMAADLGLDPTDRGVQDRVLNSLGETGTLISGFVAAYDQRPQLPLMVTVLLNVLGGGGFLALSGTFLVHEFITGAYRRSVVTTTHLTEALQRGFSGLPNPFLHTLSLVGIALMGMLIVGATMRYRQLSADGYQVLLRASLCMLLCMLLCFVLYQSFTGTITIFYTLFGVASLGGLLGAGMIEHQQQRIMVEVV